MDFYMDENAGPMTRQRRANVVRAYLANPTPERGVLGDVTNARARHASPLIKASRAQSVITDAISKTPKSNLSRPFHDNNALHNHSSITNESNVHNTSDAMSIEDTTPHPSLYQLGFPSEIYSVIAWEDKMTSSFFAASFLALYVYTQHYAFTAASFAWHAALAYVIGSYCYHKIVRVYRVWKGIHVAPNAGPSASYFDSQRIASYVHACVDQANHYAQYFQELCSDRATLSSTVKAALTFYTMSVISNWVSMSSFIFAAITAAFICPVIYRQNQEAIDARIIIIGTYIDGFLLNYKERIHSGLQSVIAKLPQTPGTRKQY